MPVDIQKIQNDLFDMQDLAYKEFQWKLMPTVAKEKVIGVRTPKLRKYAAEFAKTEDAEKFMSKLPHEYYEEDNLHGCLIEKIRDFDQCVEALERFLPFVDNWATCDMMNPKVLKKEPELLLEKIRQWMKAEDVYVVRFAMKCLMNYYLEEHFSLECPDLVAEVCREEYYIQMMQAWYFATALVKQYESILPYLLERRLNTWVHNKTIQKAVESYRIMPEQKVYLKTLKIK